MRRTLFVFAVLIVLFLLAQHDLTLYRRRKQIRREERHGIRDVGISLEAI